MAQRLARLLVWLYPRRWRLRYGEELDSLLEQASLDLPALLNLAAAAAQERLRVVLPPLGVGTGTFAVLAPCFMVLQMEALAIGQVVATMAGYSLSLDVRIGPVSFWAVEPVHLRALASVTWGPGAVALAVLSGGAGAVAAGWRRAAARWSAV